MYKKVLFLSLIIIFPSLSSAYDEAITIEENVFVDVQPQNVINLELTEDENLNYQKLRKGSVKYNKLKFKKKNNNDVYETLLFEDVNHLVPEEKSVSKSLEKEVFDNTFLGTKYNTTVDDGTKKDTFSLFSKYQKNNFSLSSSLDTKKTIFKKQRKKHSFSFSPKYKFNKHVSIKNVNSTNFYDKERKNELVLSLTPFDDDRLDFNIGAGKTYRHDRKHHNSQLNFSTQFRF